MPSDLWPRSIPPLDSAARQAVRPVITYPVDQLPPIDAVMFQRAKAQMTLIQSLTIPPRDAQAFRVPKGHFFRIVSIEGPQVGDLNLWHADNLQERFFFGKNPCPPWNSSHNGGAFVVKFSVFAHDGHHHARHT